MRSRKTEQVNFFKSSISGIAQVLLMAVLTFVGIPIFISYLGAERYGLFALVSLIGNLNIFTNLGLNQSLVKFVAERKDVPHANAYIVSAWVMIHLLVVPACLLCWFFDDTFLRLLSVPAHLVAEVRNLYALLLIANYFLLVGQLFTSVLDAIQKNHLTNTWQSCYNIMYWSGGIIALVVLKGGLTSLGFVTLFSSMGWFSLVGFSFIKHWGFPNIPSISVLKKTSRVLLKYSSKMYTIGLLTMLYEPLTKIIVGRFFGVQEVGFLEIGFRVRGLLWGLVSKITYPLYPWIASIEDSKAVKTILLTAERYLLCFVAPVILIVGYCAHDLLYLWLDSNNALLVKAVVVISVSFVIGSLALPHYYFLLAKNYENRALFLQVSGVVVNLFLLLLLYQPLGFDGVLFANGGTILVNLGWNLLWQRQVLGIGLLEKQIDFWKLAACLILTVVFTEVVVLPLMNSNYLIVSVLLRGSAIFVFCIASMFLLKFIDKTQIKSFFIAVKGAIRNTQ